MLTKEHWMGSMRYGVWDGRAQSVVDTILLIRRYHRDWKSIIHKVLPIER